MFQMTSDEVQDWKSQIVISNTEKIGLRKPPLVFTEQGVAMLSGLLSLFEISKNDLSSTFLILLCKL